MKHRRRLRSLVPDPELIRRRAAGETLRELAIAYGVSHTTLSRYFRRPAVAKQLRDARRLWPRDSAARRLAQRQLEKEMRVAAIQLSEDRARIARIVEEVHHEREARWPQRRGDLQSGNDLHAERVVKTGGGIQAVIEATGLRTLENIARLIDPVILAVALDNDAQAQTGPEPQDGLRKLVPDAELLQRRAQGQTLRCIAADYGVAHTTVCRYLRRAEVAHRLKAIDAR